MINLLTKI